jgi:hypothetical protein
MSSSVLCQAVHVTAHLSNQQQFLADHRNEHYKVQKFSVMPHMFHIPLGLVGLMRSSQSEDVNPSPLALQADIHAGPV